MKRYYYSDTIANFLDKSDNIIFGSLVAGSEFALKTTQRDAWLAQITLLKFTLSPYRNGGSIYFEYSVPRLGKRIDNVLIVRNVIFVLEFKVGEDHPTASAIDQVCDYALDLKNFHETSHDLPLAPILVATDAASKHAPVTVAAYRDRMLAPITTNAANLQATLESVLNQIAGNNISASQWEAGRYCPTPTIIEAATSLYGGHSVAEISRSETAAINLSQTSDGISQIISDAQVNGKKAICFVTGVPGAGKTLVGLNIATKHIDKNNELYSVFLSGNGPLVAILREALARDKVCREKEQGRKSKKGEALSEVKLFIQNVHNFRDECLVDS